MKDPVNHLNTLSLMCLVHRLAVCQGGGLSGSVMAGCSDKQENNQEQQHLANEGQL